ncbi:winged helix DNA-binding protein [Novosphingobium album (ex Liu et al. 2023)]|uniref:Winged helix DNA-binding protein n=1 Tax=Novosphingobium album (ex Liu et al. 2023) TaxID=3031130 RepID=A0ABT5WMT0_9SPHN|nr:winged helix DNA-binding protein [Novosphingobium album (ex Liu et al. 2023)]MDE8651348.1 winged helix DNA-binding protein [Novosphingobium album (ex Liu et al. 2023)]
MPSERLRQLAEQLLQFAETLPLEEVSVTPLAKRLEQRLRTADGISQEDLAECIKVAEQLYALRRFRDRLFGPAHRFGEAAWDILLDLFIMESRGKAIHVTSACIASAVPQSTALRCIRELERDGLIVRDLDANDARKSLLRLTDDGMRRMILALRGRFAAQGQDEPARDNPANGYGQGGDAMPPRIKVVR